MDIRRDVAGVVLAGGEGRRMGGADKGLVLLDGRPLAGHVLERFAPQVGQVIISANRNAARYAALLGGDGRVVGDLLPGFSGPLAGVQAAWRPVEEGLLMIVPCDLPYLPADLVLRLHAALSRPEVMAAYARCGERDHYACCLVRQQARDKLDGFLADGGRSIHAWLRSLNSVGVEFPDAAAFTNFNSLPT